MALVFTQTDLDNLKAALVSGALEVTIGDRTVRYRSQADLLRAIKMISESLDGSAVTSTTSANVIQSTWSKGTK